MAVRFMIETFGTDAPVNIAIKIEGGTSLGRALQEVSGLTYGNFEEQFVSWLEDWEDPEREQVRQYGESLQDATDRLRELLDEREEDARYERMANIARRTARVAGAQDLRDKLGEAAPGGTLTDLHSEAVKYFGRVIEWLNLELEHSRTTRDSRRRVANAMIPEIDARGAELGRHLADVRFNYQVDGAPK